MAERRRRAPGKRRRGRISQEDDRPRGFEPTRMRRLWQDIDQARDKLGLGSDKTANGASWTWDDWLGWASSAVGDAGAQVAAVPQQIQSVLAQLPGAGTCRMVGEGAFTLARKLPVVGTILTLVPARSDRDDEQDS